MSLLRLHQKSDVEGYLKSERQNSFENQQIDPKVYCYFSKNNAQTSTITPKKHPKKYPKKHPNKQRTNAYCFFSHNRLFKGTENQQKQLGTKHYTKIVTIELFARHKQTNSTSSCHALIKGVISLVLRFTTLKFPQTKKST